MRIIELFAGSRSFSKEAQRMGMETWSSDINPFDDIDYVANILDFDINQVPFHPEIVWCSPPCTYFSVASIGHHWTPDHQPKTKEAVLGCEIVKATIDIIHQLQPKYWFIENPRGKLRKLPFMNELTDWDKAIRHTVTYCQYTTGDEMPRMKPTDVWTNNFKWMPRPMCKNGDDCHESAPRGSKTGTQGLKGNYERSKIPSELCNEILKSCI